MTSTPVPPARAATTPVRPVLDTVFGRLWPDTTRDGHPGLVAGSLGVAVLWAVVVPYRDLGLGTLLCLLASVAVVAAAHRSRLVRGDLLPVVLCLALVATVAVRDAAWIVVLCLLAAFVTGAATLTRARSFPALVASAAAPAAATLRDLPWLGRSLRRAAPARARDTWWSVVRTLAVSALLVLVFGALFASADAVFARWVDLLVPDLRSDTWLVRGFVAAFAFVLTTAGTFVALSPPDVERLALPRAATVRRFEWAVPVLLVDLTFAAFLLAQATAMFGGHAHLRATTGLTYAEYVHEGFGQLTAATVLTLAVVAAAVRRAPRTTSRDRALLRGLLGLLCLLTLVVVASALYRMHLYEEAYGFTRLRVLVSVFEGWLGLVVLLVAAAGVTLRGRWVPRAALLTGAALLLGLAAVNPDGYVAERNVERFERTGKVDLSYLGGLSADAAPALAALPADLRSCLAHGAAGGSEDDWLEWNLGRARAARLQPDSTTPPPAGCAARLP